MHYAVKRQKEIRATKDGSPPASRERQPFHTTTVSSGVSTAHANDNAQIVPTSNENAATFRQPNKDHYRIINSVLDNLKVKSQLDGFGIAFLPMKKVQPFINNEPINMLMVIEAPASREMFQLYTHFNASMERWQRQHQQQMCNGSVPSANTSGGSTATRSTSEKDRVFDNLLNHGRHKSLSLTAASEDRVKFSFEGKNSEIRSADALMAILSMFVKVSFRMEKRVDAVQQAS